MSFNPALEERDRFLGLYKEEKSNRDVLLDRIKKYKQFGEKFRKMDRNSKWPVGFEDEMYCLNEMVCITKRR